MDERINAGAGHGGTYAGRHTGTYAGDTDADRVALRASFDRRPDFVALYRAADERRAARANLRPDPRSVALARRARLDGLWNDVDHSGRVRASDAGHGDVFWNVVLAAGLGVVCLAGGATAQAVNMLAR